MTHRFMLSFSPIIFSPWEGTCIFPPVCKACWPDAERQVLQTGGNVLQVLGKENGIRGVSCRNGITISRNANNYMRKRVHREDLFWRIMQMFWETGRFLTDYKFLVMTEVEDRHWPDVRYRRLFPRVAKAKEAFGPGIIYYTASRFSYAES